MKTTAVLYALLPILASAPVQAATLASPDFTASITIDGVTSGPANGTAGTPGDCDIFGDASGCDLDTGDSIPRLLVNWVDDDSFDIFFFGQIGFGTAPVEFTLAGLNYLVDGVPTAITGFLFNFGASNVEGFLKSEGNPDGADFTNPTVSFTANSVTAFFADYSGQLDGDGPRMRFDVLVGDTPPPAEVPLPAAGGLMAAGILALGALRRRARNR
ncbi:MAG: hypothetical protein DI533_06835 [Cereibacter sphaeroides]|uniref:VPLPA-CTERM sorting domain-containing protein n=1 Tax=Cereibacter sphaeroides TaxID=1063 RepID=A0A2W5SB82_CERSP|nr:MAG: hypothetical protein DI533_06835 [Cereibacter sphaeroides]